MIWSSNLQILYEHRGSKSPNIKSKLRTIPAELIAQIKIKLVRVTYLCLFRTRNIKAQISEILRTPSLGRNFTGSYKKSVGLRLPKKDNTSERPLDCRLEVKTNIIRFCSFYLENNKHNKHKLYSYSYFRKYSRYSSTTGEHWVNSMILFETSPVAIDKDNCESTKISSSVNGQFIS